MVPAGSGDQSVLIGCGRAAVDGSDGGGTRLRGVKGGGDQETAGRASKHRDITKFRQTELSDGSK